MKKIIIVHGWGGSPEKGWFPSVKKELEGKALVYVPAMPNPDIPEIEHWVNHLAKTAGKTDENSYFIGHSIGCQTILRYLEKLPENTKIMGVLLVAGWTTLTPQATASPEDMAIATPWVQSRINFAKISKMGEFVSLFSDNDPYVPEENWTEFRKLGRVIVEHGKQHIERKRDAEMILQFVKKIMKIQ